MKYAKDIRRTPEESLDAEFIDICKSVTAKRARTVIDHILQHGIITNEELNEIYNYDHPPRAIRDVRENGIPLLTHRVVSDKTGRKIGAYTFDRMDNVRHGRIGGRRAFSKQFKQLLLKTYGSLDAFTGELLDERYLQIDHRVPYEVAGDNDTLDVQDYMLLDASSQRAKSWTCEHCQNLNEFHDREICRKCFWASPEKYSHICLKEQRRIDVVWSDAETKNFDLLKEYCEKKDVTIQEHIKSLLDK